jgi:ribosomal protein S18 acetylase RimI-like enzyme
MPDVVVRDAVAADARGIAETQVRAWRAAYRGLLPDEQLAAMTVAAREGIWQGILAAAEPRAFTLVAGATGEALGFCSVLPSRDDDATERMGEIAALYVDPGRWRQGIGHALVARALERMARAGWTEATLWVLDGNAPALAFYRAHGFADDGARARHEPSGRAELRLRAVLHG